MRNRSSDRLTSHRRQAFVDKAIGHAQHLPGQRDREALTMNPRRLLLLVTGLGGSALLAQPLGSRLLAQGTPTLALHGHVKSAEERSMEGVIVTARKTGATIATSVVTNA